MASLGDKLEESLSRDCDFACYATPTNCAEFTAAVNLGGCAATCKAEKGDAWFTTTVAAMCPPAVKIASSLAFALPTGKTFADTGLADPDSPARANFEKDFKAQMAAKVRPPPGRADNDEAQCR